MFNLKFDLIKNRLQPSFYMYDEISRRRYTVLYDTGAFVSLWTNSEDDLINMMSARDTHLVTDISGISDVIGVRCKLYAINIRVCNHVLYNIPIAVFHNESIKSHIILSSSLFRHDRIVIDDGVIDITVKTDNNSKVFPIKNNNGIYVPVFTQSEIDRLCPICCSELLSTGLCVNPLCDYNEIMW